jgi:hypothetical protein
MVWRGVIFYFNRHTDFDHTRIQLDAFRIGTLRAIVLGRSLRTIINPKLQVWRLFRVARKDRLQLQLQFPTCV